MDEGMLVYSGIYIDTNGWDGGTRAAYERSDTTTTDSLFWSEVRRISPTPCGASVAQDKGSESRGKIR